MNAQTLTRGVIALSLFIGAGLLSIAGGCSPAEPEQKQSQTQSLKRVRTAEAQRLAGIQELRFSGLTRAVKRARLTFQVSGRLASRPVDIGQQVGRGQLIARLDNPQLQPSARAAAARVDELKARLAQAQRDVERVEKLYAEKAATKEELEQTRAQRDALKASLDTAQAQSREAGQLYGETTLQAPFAGVVEQVFLEPGEFVPSGQPVVEISGAGELEAEFGIPENLIDELAVGDAVSLRFPFLDDAEVRGTVDRFAGASSRVGRLFPVVVRLDEAALVGRELRPGLTVELIMPVAGQAALTVPIDAVADPAGGAPRVYVVDAGRAERRDVQVGELVNERVVVSGDLTEGDKVVVVGLSGLTDGQQVDVIE